MMTSDPECDSCRLVLPDTQMCCPGRATQQGLVSAAGWSVLDLVFFFFLLFFFLKPFDLRNSSVIPFPTDSSFGAQSQTIQS